MSDAERKALLAAMLKTQRDHGPRPAMPEPERREVLAAMLGRRPTR